MAKKDKKNKSKFKEKLTFKYRLVVLNEETFEERFSFKLNRLNVFVFSGLFALFLIAFTTFLIAFTPLREYIPGYSSAKLKKQATTLLYKIDSLEQNAALNEEYINGVREVLTGKFRDIKLDKDSIIQQLRLEDANLQASAEDSIFREQVEREDRYTVFQQAKRKADIVFFTPIKGTITEPYKPAEKHYAIDIAVTKNTPVKAAADGTVIFTGFTAETGFVIILEHAKNFLTVYKHNEKLHKAQGDLVQAGEVIANAGSTGALSTGPHLHFELWNDGYPVNPINFIDFE